MDMILILMIFVTVFISLWGLIGFVKPRKNPLDRLETWMLDTVPAKEEIRLEKKSWIGVLGSGAEKMGLGKRYMEKTRIELIRADIPLTGYEFNMMRALFALGLSLLLYPVFRSLFGAFATLVLVWLIPMVYVKLQKAKRNKLFGEQLGDALTILANSLRAGFSFLQAVNSVAREMPDPIAREFTKLLKEMSMGLSTETSLANLLVRVQSDDMELLVTAILIQKEIGGNLSEILDNIASTIRERVRIKNEIRALTAQGKLSGIIVGGLPIALGLFLFLSNPSYMDPLFTTPLGKVMIGYGVFSELIGFWLIGRIIKIEV